ncbi:hypothetical protein B0H66DRAFT_7308 [Apodospora peruviana]|uniref:SprT-like domain-containing protein n=1 Tax=Apodospora peruviana TaxID=516989 RepID=A0AAE0ME02_9PEZI|nr:hypothetical protein B0H66DRAFT_7308 [Apodospora peruviana]
MAHPVAGGDQRPPIRFSSSAGGLNPFPVKRRSADTDSSDDDDSNSHRLKRLRYAQYADHVNYRALEDDELHRGGYPPHLHSPHPHHPYPHHRPEPEPATAAAAPCAMERTASGHSIRPDPTEGCAMTELLEDDEAAQRVRDHLATFRRRCPDSKHERILRSIINPRRPNAEQHYPLDNDSLESIFSAANEIFFNGRLSQRVMWDWSHESSEKYDSSIIGTTALRRASTRGFETLIVLSSPILRDAKYSRRLLISTFLHELIHSYLFICCGFRARHCGGHTPGFQAIATIVDDWVGAESGLYLGRMEADLERFRIVETGGRSGGAVDYRIAEQVGSKNVSSYFPCSGISEQQEYNKQQQQQLLGGGGGGHGQDYYNQPNSNNTWWRHPRGGVGGVAIRSPLYIDEEQSVAAAHHTFYVPPLRERP